MKSGEQQNLIVEMQHGMFDLFLQKKKGVSGKSMWVGINHRKPVEEEFFVHNAP